MSLLIRYLNTYRNFSKATWINILAVFVMSFGLMMSSIFTLFLNHKGIGVHEIGWIIAIGGVGGILGSYLCGIIAAYISVTRIAQYSILFFALIMVSFPLARHINLFFILFFLANFCLGLFRPANNLMLFAHTPVSEHLRVMALNRVAFNLGLAFATIIGTALAAIHFSLFFIFSASTCLLAVLILFKFNSLLSTPIHHEKQNTINNELPIWRTFFLQQFFIILCLLFLGYNLIFNQIRSMYGLFLTQFYFLNLHTIGLLFMINFILIVFLEVPLMSKLKQVNQLTLAMCGSVLVGLGMFILPFASSLIFAIISMLLWSMGEILASSAFFVLAARFAEPRAKHFYISFFHSIFSSGLILAPLMGGFLYPLWHGYLLWIACGMITAMITVGFLYLKQQGKILNVN